MSFFPASLENLIDKFASLPGIGRKSAQRLAFHILSLPESEALSFADAVVDARKSVHCCRYCQARKYSHMQSVLYLRHLNPMVLHLRHLSAHLPCP